MLITRKNIYQPNTNYKKEIHCFMWCFHSPLLSNTQNRQTKEERRGVCRQNLFLYHFFFFSLSLFPFNDLRDTYCIFSFRLKFIRKNTPVSTDLMQERECEMLFWKSSCRKGLLKFTRSTLRLTHTHTHTQKRYIPRSVLSNTHTQWSTCNIKREQCNF